jgi:tripartite-type tricarboxylate transporter receptor subunit TctC
MRFWSQRRRERVMRKEAVSKWALASLSCASMVAVVYAQPYPTKPIRFVVGFGAGGGNHLSQEMFKYMAGIDMVHVPYKGAAEQLTALIGGEVQMSCIQVQVALTQMRAGRLRALAITGAQRLAIAPDVPTIAEAGVPGYEATSWQGVVVPAGTPRAIVNRMHTEIAKALQAPDVSQRLAAEGTTAGGITPDAFAAFIQSETAKWAKVVKIAGARAD